ncbi:hypothetical protein C475_21579 [Halosimplex carlsbadense 2-9-1]|uniref:TraB determinant protein n=1 Tax=Halosimplex carlsbadense 2-9-1 TaxID=797114 RepID=M0CC59_9EURY|nr:hypothetical protein [Halosimplex carlsbadense]ELZ19932.1 hypothetical protein C475_21579 [Halosimplex carlsbadense 2-9-1]
MTDDSRADPGLASEYQTTLAGGAVTLVGVVHDHPASVTRVSYVVERRSPDVLALELPPLAVGLYEAHAARGTDPLSFGGEMSAAIRAAETDRVVGIDGPSRRFCRELAARFVRDRSGVGTVTRSLRGVASVTRTAVACRLAAAVARRTARAPTVGSRTEYDVAPSDPPERQAEDERRQADAATAVLDAFEKPPASRIRSETREAHMADRLREFSRGSDVVAVVGLGHFDPLVDRLSG